MTLTPEDIAAGWVEWRGGECPVKPQCVVEVRYRDAANSAKGTRIEWQVAAGRLAWQHDGEDDDIMAYRLSPSHLRLHPAPVADEEKGRCDMCDGTGAVGYAPDDYSSCPECNSYSKKDPS